MHLFGSESLYQVAPSRKPTEGAEIGSELRVRILFSEDLTLEELHRRVAAGQELRATSITEQFGAREWRAQHGEDAVPLFAVSEAGVLTVATAGTSFEPRPGDTLVGLVPGEGDLVADSDADVARGTAGPSSAGGR